MKVIDILNKIANGEEIPEKIRVKYRIFEKYLNHNAYLNTEDEENYKYLTDLPRLYDDDRDWLNEEVEIIEENKKIEKITKVVCDSDLIDRNHFVIEYLAELKYKINEIIEVLNNDR